jgi:deazaflavin-dependent oxidoreductase (nitroreductase family)
LASGIVGQRAGGHSTGVVCVTDEDLVRWGRLLLLETSGRRTGRRVRATIGFVPERDGAMLVAASSSAPDWALNLRADPHCTVTVGDQTLECRAEELTDGEHARAVRELILRYGTPSERLGEGPAFRLRPLNPPSAG